MMSFCKNTLERNILKAYDAAVLKDFGCIFFPGNVKLRRMNGSYAPLDAGKLVFVRQPDL